MLIFNKVCQEINFLTHIVSRYKIIMGGVLMANNKSGRKRRFKPDIINKIIEEHNNGRSVSELAEEYGVSRQTMSFYIHEVAAELEISRSDTTAMLVREMSYWKKLNKDFDLSPEELSDYKARYDYMLGDDLLTAILVDFMHEQIVTVNYSSHPMKRAFGVKRCPTWNDFMKFIEDRCVPRSRDHMKVILRDYKLDSYDPFAIVERTGGRMAEDERYIKIYRMGA